MSFEPLTRTMLYVLIVTPSGAVTTTGTIILSCSKLSSIVALSEFLTISLSESLMFAYFKDVTCSISAVFCFFLHIEYLHSYS